MNHKEIVNALGNRLEEHGSVWQIVSIEHLEEVTDEINERYREGEISEEIFCAYLSNMQSSASGLLPGSRSIIVIATPQPMYRVGFTRNGQVHRFSIPPTYLHYTDLEVEEIIKNNLEPAGLVFAPARLPEKLLAVRSGIAQYGRNNITYIEGMGSFHRIRCYYTDLPGLTNQWRNSELLDSCTKCSACIDRCPTGALSHDRFLVHAKRCLTFYNETTAPWPHYVKCSWDLDSKCIVGCMKCQLGCPVNRRQRNWIEPVEVFSEEETRELLEVTEPEHLPEPILKKIERLYLTEYIPTLSRNLNLLFQAA